MAPHSRVSRVAAAVAGIVSALVLLAVAEALAAFLDPVAGPVSAVSSFIVDIVPRPLKEFAITVFGEADKIALLVIVCILALIAAAGAGLLQLARRPWGAVLLGLGGVLGVSAAVTRHDATGLAWLPTVVGTLLAVAFLAMLLSRVRRIAEADHDQDAREIRLSRRSFLAASATTAVGSIVIGIGARLISEATLTVSRIREELTLPTPRSRVTFPEGADLNVLGLSPIVTPNADFYRIDTAFNIPNIDPAEWTLQIDGMVDTPIEMTFADLIAEEFDEYSITLLCVSNEVGGSLIGNAVWTGTPVRELLRRAGPHSDADMVLSTSIDGFTASTPLEMLTDDGVDAILAVGMNGEPLPLHHGFPVRMVVPGLYGYVSATKWLTRLTVTRFDQVQAYWTPRGYSERGPIKMSSRIDTPTQRGQVDAGTVVIAGLAWAQPIGVQRVEVRIGDGDWTSAELSTPVNDSTWRQWVLEWDASPGTYDITVRAIDNDGTVQTDAVAAVAPDGATGLHSIQVTVVG